MNSEDPYFAVAALATLEVVMILAWLAVDRSIRSIEKWLTDDARRAREES